MQCRPTIIATLACGLFASAAAAQVPTYLPQPNAAAQPTFTPTPPQPRSSYDPIPAYTPGTTSSAPTSAPVYVPPAPIYAPPQVPQGIEPVPTSPNVAPNYSGPTYSSPGATYPNSPPNAYPGYGGAYSPGMPSGEMEAGTFNRQDFPPGGVQAPPGSCSKWLPTYSRPILPGSRTPGPTQCYPQSECYPGSECSPQKMVCDTCGNWYDNISAFTAVDAFKGPLDLDGLNGNFGKRAGAMASFPIWKSGGIGGQVGGSAGVYDWKGSQFTGEDTRFQNFWTAGLFHRSCTTGLGFAIGYDWLFDRYYNDLDFGQFRVAGSWQINCKNEIGVWAALPDRRDWATIGAPPVSNGFSPILQGNAYWRHTYNPGAWTTVFGGLAETPSDVSFGSSSQVALNCYVALFGGFEYILPGSGGNDGYQEEVWALSFGVAFYPGSAMRVGTSQFRPFLPMADNGNFAIWRK